MKIMIACFVLLCGVAAATTKASSLPSKSEVVKPVYCGPMFTPSTTKFDPDTYKCISLVLAAGNVAFIIAHCKDGREVKVLVWMTNDGIDLQSYAEVCDGVDAGAPPDMSEVPDMAKAVKVKKRGAK